MKPDLIRQHVLFFLFPPFFDLPPRLKQLTGEGARFARNESVCHASRRWNAELVTECRRMPPNLDGNAAAIASICNPPVKRPP